MPLSADLRGPWWLRRAGPGFWHGRFGLRQQGFSSVLPALAVLLLALLALSAALPMPPPEARLFSDGWGASSQVDPSLCVSAPGAAQTGLGALPVTPVPPPPTRWIDRLSLALQYLAWGLLVPVLALAALWQRGARLSPAVLCTGLLGAAPAYFQWPFSPLFVGLRQALGSWVVERIDLTEAGFAWLDGAALLLWLAAAALLLGGATWGAMRGVGQLVRLDPRELIPSLLPLVAVTLGLGLTMDAALFLRGEGVDIGGLRAVRAVLLVAALGRSGWLGWRAIVCSPVRPAVPRAAAALLWLLPLTLVAVNGWLVYFYWLPGMGRYHV